MTHYYETKVGKIIEKYADARVDGAIIAYITEHGWENVKEITDEEIDSITQEQCGFIHVDLWKGCLKAAREICQTCDMYADFFTYIRKFLGINGSQIHDMTIYKENYNADEWEDLCDKYTEYSADYPEPKEINSIDLICIFDGIE